MNDGLDLSPLWLSLKTAAIATLIVFITGLFVARLLARRQFFGKSAVEALIMLPLVLPPTVVGFALLYLFGKNGFIGKRLIEWFDFQIVFSWWGVLIAAIVVSFPLMYQSASAAFQQFDKNIENAARTMGASEWKIFRTISFPLAWPGLLSGIVLTFARALGEFGATLMVAGFIKGVTNTIPLAIYFAVDSGNMEHAKIWVAIIITLGFSAILWLNWWSRRNMERHAQSNKW